MAKVTSKNAILVINGYEFSTYASAFSINSDTGKIDVTGLTDGCVNYIPGLPTAQITANMFWDSAADKVHAALGAMTASGNVTILPEGWTLGNPSISQAFMQANYQPAGTPTDALNVGTINFEASGTDAITQYGWTLQHGTITATTTGTGYDDPTGGAVTARCSGTIHVWTPTSTDTYIVKIQHSTTLGSGYADLVTFTVNGTTRTSERVSVASGTINRYRRVLATRTGAAADPFGFTVHFWHA